MSKKYKNKKFHNLKLINKKCNNLKLNKQLRCQYIDDFIVENVIIKQYTDYIIYKEINTRVYILSIPNFIIIQYKYTKNLEDFLLLYTYSNDLLFDMYKNCNYYYIICVSKYKEVNFDYEMWLTSNDANYKYTLLTTFYNSFFVINKTWYNKENIFIYEKSIGNGSVNIYIRNQLKMYIKMINEMKYLPCHYLKL